MSQALRGLISQTIYEITQEFGNLDNLMMDDENFRVRIRKLLSLTNSLQTRLGILDAELEREEEKKD